MLKGKSAEVAKFIIELVDEVAPNSGNKERYEEYFSKISEKDFAEFIKDLKEGRTKISVALPINSNKVDLERNFKILRRLGYEPYQHLWFKQDGADVRTNEKFLIVDLPVRRMSQVLDTKAKIPKNYKTVDMLTGQPTGDSKGAKMSYPELQICAAMGLDNCMVELMKYRGGDAEGYNALMNTLTNYGRAQQEQLKHFSGTVKSSVTLKNYLNAIHIRTESLV
jgi:hypothetical protein